MKIRAILLIALVIGGTYAMLESINDYTEKSFLELFKTMDADFESLTFTRPPMHGTPAEKWVIDDEAEVNELLQFLQKYHIKKLKQEEINPDDELDDLSIMLNDSKGNSIEIIVAENLIIQNSLLYYEIVDGPLDVDWIVRFFVNNKS